jgi:hypothetical protein
MIKSLEMNQKLVTNIMSTTARTAYIHALIHVGMIWHRLYRAPLPAYSIPSGLSMVYPLPPFSAHNRTDCIGVRPPEEEK